MEVYDYTQSVKAFRISRIVLDGYMHTVQLLGDFEKDLVQLPEDEFYRTLVRPGDYAVFDEDGRFFVLPESAASRLILVRNAAEVQCP